MQTELPNIRMAETEAPAKKGMERVKGLDLYLLLEVDSTAEMKEIKKAYRYYLPPYPSSCS